MNTKRLIASAAGLGALAVIASSAVPVMAQWHRPAQGQNQPTASWSEIDKKPDFGTNSRPGFYVWRDRDDVYVVANDPNRSRASRYSGEVMVMGGSISNASGYQTERHDHYQQPSSNRLRFSFVTNNGLDGIKFHVNSGKRIVLNLHDVDRNAYRIFLGKYEIPTTRKHIVIAK